MVRGFFVLVHVLLLVLDPLARKILGKRVSA
jgi:hypothetical protein